MLKGYIFPVGLAFVFFNLQGEVKAEQSLKAPPVSHGRTLETGDPALEKILAKMKNNDFSTVSPKEMEAFDQTVKQI